MEGSGAIGKNRKARNIDMCTRPLLGKIILFSLPLIATGILQLLYNAADIIVVGQFSGHTAMAAVGSTGSLVNLVTNLFIGLSVGSLSAMSRWIGAGEKEKADRIVHTSIPVGVIGGVVVGVIGFFGAELFLKWMKTDVNVIDQATLYLKIYFVGMPFAMLYNFGAAILRACGDTKRPLIILSLAGLINVGLNLWLVAGFNMGVAGVAIGTTASQAISAVAVLWVLWRRKGYGCFRFKKMHVYTGALKEIVHIGLPAGVQGTIFSLSNVIIQSSINIFGDIAMAGNAAAASIEGFVYTAMNAVSQACLTFTAQNYGANKLKNIRLILVQCVAATSFSLQQRRGSHRLRGGQTRHRRNHVFFVRADGSARRHFARRGPIARADDIVRRGSLRRQDHLDLYRVCRGTESDDAVSFLSRFLAVGDRYAPHYVFLRDRTRKKGTFAYRCCGSRRKNFIGRCGCFGGSSLFTPAGRRFFFGRRADGKRVETV